MEPELVMCNWPGYRHSTQALVLCFQLFCARPRLQTSIATSLSMGASKSKGLLLITLRDDLVMSNYLPPKYKNSHHSINMRCKVLKETTNLEFHLNRGSCPWFLFYHRRNELNFSTHCQLCLSRKFPNSAHQSRMVIPWTLAIQNSSDWNHHAWS
jgi:hypothetical protein